jgi:hypothetical protein
VCWIAIKAIAFLSNLVPDLIVLIGASLHPRDNPAVREVRDIVSKLSDPVDPGFTEAVQEQYGDARGISLPHVLDRHSG